PHIASLPVIALCVIFCSWVGWSYLRWFAVSAAGSRGLDVVATQDFLVWHCCHLARLACVCLLAADRRVSSREPRSKAGGWGCGCLEAFTPAGATKFSDNPHGGVGISHGAQRSHARTVRVRNLRGDRQDG